MSVSVYFSSQSIKIAEGKVGKDGIALNSLISVPIPSDCMINGVITNDVPVKTALSEAWAKNKLPKSNICIVIDSGSVMMKIVTVPFTSERNIVSIVKREFADVDNFEDMLFDYTVQIPALPEGGGTVLAYGAEKAFIGSYVDLFSDIKGAKISRITASQDSTVKFMKKYGRLGDSSAITAVIDGNILSLTLFAEGEYKLTNRSRLINEPGTPEYTDEVAYAISSVIQFNRAEISNIYFFGDIDNSRQFMDNINLLLERQNSNMFPFIAEIVSAKKPPVGTSELTGFMYCLGCM